MNGKTAVAGVLVALWSATPIYWVANLSFQTRIQIYTLPAYLFPQAPTLENYLRAFGLSTAAAFGSVTGNGLVPQYVAGLQNSMLVATSVMILTLLLCIPAGYAFARFSFPARTAIFFAILFSRSLPPISTAVPYYQFYKAAGLLGTIPGLVLVHMTLTVPLTTWVLSGFFSSLPVELDKQARVDGCSRFRLFRSILIPIAAPGLAAVAILAWLTSWNEFVLGLLLAYINGLYTVAPAMAAAVPSVGASSDVELFVAFTSFAMVPSVIAAVVLQRFMTRLKIVDPLTFRAPG